MKDSCHVSNIKALANLQKYADERLEKQAASAKTSNTYYLAF